MLRIFILTSVETQLFTQHLYKKNAILFHSFDNSTKYAHSQAAMEKFIRAFDCGTKNHRPKNLCEL